MDPTPLFAMIRPWYETEYETFMAFLRPVLRDYFRKGHIRLGVDRDNRVWSVNSLNLPAVVQMNGAARKVGIRILLSVGGTSLRLGSK